MKHVVRTLADLGPDLVLAPERWLVAESTIGGGNVRLDDLVVERRERSDARDAVVIDTTHARDGVFDIAAAMRVKEPPKSVKKVAVPGDLVVSRLRPYLRQIAYVHPRVLALTKGRPLALSSEFYVLSPRSTATSLAFLLPILLGDETQEILKAAQEGGHHPRVPRASLLGLGISPAAMRGQAKRSREVLATLDALYESLARFDAMMTRA